MSPSSTHQRSSIVDVFENFLGLDIERLERKTFVSLSKEQALELTQQLDLSLASAAEETFAEDAVVLDGFASPTIIPFDRTVPRTMRRGKQIALAHTEVIIPLQEVSSDFADFGYDHLVSFGLWAKSNAVLLRSHVFSPVQPPGPLDVINAEQMTDLGDWLIENLLSISHQQELNLLIPKWRELDADQLLQKLSPLVYSTMQDAVASGIFNTSLSFTQETAGRFYHFCAQILGHSPTGEGNPFSQVTLLHDLELPSIEDLADEDFASIRQDSEEFDEFRGVLRRALRETSNDVAAGKELNSSFQSHMGEVRWRAELLNRDIKAKSLGKFFKSTGQSVGIGSFVSTAAAAASTAAQHAALDPTSLMARFGTSSVLAILFALLFYKRPERQQRLLRFYDVLLKSLF